MRAGRFTVGALTVCNAVGNVHDPETGEFIAGARRGTRALRMGDVLEEVLGGKGTESKATTIGVVATDAPLSRDQLWRLALVAHDGLTLAVRPAHLTTDGDAFFALTTNPRGDGLTPDEVDALCYMAVSTTAQAIVRGVMAAQRVED
jgi:L-aminopeptidase/D-esterase-like protein